MPACLSVGDGTGLGTDTFLIQYHILESRETSRSLSSMYFHSSSNFLFLLWRPVSVQLVTRAEALIPLKTRFSECFLHLPMALFSDSIFDPDSLQMEPLRSPIKGRLLQHGFSFILQAIPSSTRPQGTCGCVMILCHVTAELRYTWTLCPVVLSQL